MLSIPEEIWEGGASESSAGGNGLSWKEIVIEDGTFNQLAKRYAAPGAGIGERGAEGGRQLVLADRTETCAVTFQVSVNTMYVCVCVCVYVYTYIGVLTHSSTCIHLSQLPRFTEPKPTGVQDGNRVRCYNCHRTFRVLGEYPVSILGEYPGVLREHPEVP